MDEFSNRAARFYSSLGISKEDSVAIFLETRVEYPSVWLGLMKIGAVGALINTNQRTQVLEHSLKISGAKLLIYGTELTQGNRYIICDKVMAFIILIMVIIIMGVLAGLLLFYFYLQGNQ